jgi:hypothetical protein
VNTVIGKLLIWLVIVSRCDDYVFLVSFGLRLNSSAVPRAGNNSINATGMVEQSQTVKARSRTSARPPRVPTAHHSHSTLTSKRRPITQPSANTSAITHKSNPPVNGFFPQYTSSADQSSVSRIGSQQASLHFDCNDPAVNSLNSSHQLVPPTSVVTTSDPNRTASLLTSLMLKPSPKLTNAPIESSKKNSKKKLTRKTHSAPVGQPHNKVSSKHSTHITPVSTSANLKKKTTHTTTNSHVHREPTQDEYIHSGTGVRLLYRPVASPVSTFSRSKRI